MQLIIAIALFLLAGLMWLVLEVLKRLNISLDEYMFEVAKQMGWMNGQLHTIKHDAQQIKTRLTWSRKREKKDLKQEARKGVKK